MNWTGPEDVRAQLRRLWDSGAILSSQATGVPLFPRRLNLRRPTSADLLDRFEDVRSWSATLRELRHCRLEMRAIRHRTLGANEVPHALWIDTPGDALALIGRTREAAQFETLLTMTRAQQPELLCWLARRPLRGLELTSVWPHLLRVVAWVSANPRPGIHLRQVDLPGIHSKFIEAHRGALGDLLDAVLTPEQIESGAGGAAQFARRYGFRDKPPRIRFRVLDPALAPFAAGTVPDITLDADTFARLDCRASRVFITENEVNFLAFPTLRDSLVVFGAGYGFDALAGAGWLTRCRIHYWGDIDTHGFAILDQLRARFAQAESFLMDRATLMAFESLWGTETAPIAHDLPRLTPEERALYDDLRDHRLQRNLRLEQEHIGFGWVEAALQALDGQV